jgi:hypothetical protein
MPPKTRAELIGGVVHLHAPGPRSQGDLEGRIIAWIKHYQWATRGVQASWHVSVLLDDQAEPEPAAVLRILPTCGGQTHNAGTYIAGAPELVVEVASATTRATDLGPKHQDYQRAGVLEYLVVARGPDEVSWSIHRDGQFVPLPPGPDGVFRSEVFPGLWLDTQAVFAAEPGRLIATLDRGLATPEHASFVAHLASQRAKSG